MSENDSERIDYLRGRVVSLGTRVETLEKLVIVLARGILCHEYAKDLSRANTEEILKVMCNEEDLEAARRLVEE
jgi:hypothetical protein